MKQEVKTDVKPKAEEKHPEKKEVAPVTVKEEKKSKETHAGNKNSHPHPDQKHEEGNSTHEVHPIKTDPVNHDKPKEPKKEEHKALEEAPFLLDDKKHEKHEKHEGNEKHEGHEKHEKEEAKQV